MSTPENTKLCDFTSTNNNDFIYTPIAPLASTTAFYEIKSALLNLVMKEQFSSVSTDDATSYLNNFVELCDMQKYKDIDEYLIKLKLFPFSLRGRAKFCVEIVLIHGLNVKMFSLENTILLLRLYP